MKTGPVGVTGVGCICAPGESLQTIMPVLYAGKRIYQSKGVEADIEKTSPVFEITTPLDGLKTKNEGTRTTLLMMHAFLEAFEESGLDRSILKGKKVGVVMGTTVGCTLNNEPFYRSYKKKEYPDTGPIQTFLKNNGAAFLSAEYDLIGPSVTIANACSSGTDAIGIGKRWIEDGECDIVFAGGSDELCRTTYLGFTSLQITSPNLCKPFDKERNGLNLGEGAGMLILESSDHIKNRNAKVLAYIDGYGTSADAYHPTAPHPEGKGLTKAMEIALQDAVATPYKIAFINAHGTSTVDNDKVEGKVLRSFFPDNKPVVSTKSYTGHTLGGAGGIEAALTIKGLQDQKIPATAGFQNPDSDCEITPTTENTVVTGDLAISTSLAFGGNNSVLVIRVAR